MEYTQISGYITRFNGGELALVAFKQKKSEEEIKKIANPFFPS